MHSVRLKTWLVINILKRSDVKSIRSPGVMVHVCDPSTWETAAREFQLLGLPGLQTICKKYKHEHQTKQIIIRSVVSSA